MSRKLIFDKKQVFEQFFGSENMSKKMSSCPSRVYTGFRAKRWAAVLPGFIQVFERKGGQPSFRFSSEKHVKPYFKPSCP